MEDISIQNEIENEIKPSEPAPKKEGSIKKNYMFNLMAKFVALAIPIIITPYLSRILEPDGNGKLSFIASIVSYFILAANLGIETYGLKIIAVNRDNPAKLKKIIIEIFLLRTILTFFFALTYFIVFMFTAKDDYLLYAIYGSTLVFTILDFTWFFQGVEDFKAITISHIISKIIYIPLIFLLVKTKNDLWIACLLTCISTILGYLIFFPKLFLYIKKAKVNDKIRPFSHLRECLIYFVPTIAVQIYTVLDKTMIGLITQSSFENGYYEQAEKVVKLPVLLIISLNVIMQSRIAYYYSEKRFDDIKRIVDKSMSYSLCVSIPITFGMIAIAKTFVPIYLGEGYDKCVYLMYILSPLVVIITISNLLATHYFTPYDKQRTSNKFLIVGSLVNLAFNSFLIYFYQSIGAAIASIIAEIVVTALYMIFARKEISPLLFLKKSIKYLIAGSVMFGVVFFMNIKLPGSIWYLIVEVLVGIIIYFGLLIILKDKFVLDSLKMVINKIRRK